ncbi:hypothetical protein Tco_0122663 [Tanacetum coccineum]
MDLKQESYIEDTPSSAVFIQTIQPLVLTITLWLDGALAVVQTQRRDNHDSALAISTHIIRAWAPKIFVMAPSEDTLITEKAASALISKAQDLISWVRGLVRVNRGSQAIDPKIRAAGNEAQMVEGLKIGYLCTADLPLKRPSMQQVVGLLKDIEPV